MGQFIRHFGAKVIKLTHNKTGATGRASIKCSDIEDLSIVLPLKIGSHDVTVKYFKPNDPMSHVAFQRTLDMHRVCKNAGLVPDLLAFCADEQIVITAVVLGSSFRKTLSADTVVGRAKVLGRWHGQFASHAPTRPASGTMNQYLRHHYLEETDSFFKHSVFLKNIPVQAEALTCSNLRPGAFTCLADDRLILADPFFSCTFMPVG